MKCGTKKAVSAVAVCAAAFALASCSAGGEAESTPSPTASHEATPTEDATPIEVVELTAAQASVEAVMEQNQRNHADAHDVEYEETGATRISLGGASAKVEGEGATAASEAVTISAEGTYILSGDYSGTVKVAAGANDKVKLVLDGVSIESDGAAIEAASGNELVIIMAEGSENTLIDTHAAEHAAAAAEAEETGSDDSSIPSGTIDSSIDTTMGGAGTLTVSGGQNAISTSDGLAIYSGNITVTSADDGIRGKDYVWIEGGSITVTATGDAIQATNDTEAERGFIYLGGGQVTVNESEKAIDAKTDLVIDGATIDVTASDDAVEGGYVLFAAGSGEITSDDDPINATLDGSNPWIVVLGGQWTASGQGDGIDSNGEALISGGSVTVFGPVGGGNGAIDTEAGLTITGGTLFAIGSQGMDEGPSLDSPQASVKFTGNFAVGTTLTITDADGTELASYTNRSAGQSIFFSHPAITSGQTYTLAVDGAAVATGVAGDYAENRMGDPGQGGMEPPGGVQGPGGMQPPNGAEPPGGMEPPGGFGAPSQP